MTISVPLSKSRRLNGFVFLSGELGFNPDGTMPKGIEDQTTNTLRRIADTLDREGLAMADVVSCTCFLTSNDDFAAFNDVYRQFFDDPLPVRTTVGCSLMIDARVEITVIAAAR